MTDGTSFRNDFSNRTETSNVSSASARVATVDYHVTTNTLHTLSMLTS